MSNDSRTWTADQIREAVMNYSEGCGSGKVQFLMSEFQIDANPSQKFTVVLTVTVPTYSSDYDGEIDCDAISSAIESVLDDSLGEQLELANYSDVDCRGRGVRYGHVGFEWVTEKAEEAK